MPDHATADGAAPGGGAAGLDGPALLGWARAAVAELELQRGELNSLNVFPVPDADTGSNMTATMAAALRAAEDAGDAAPAADIAASLADGAVRGARGNSGTVLSQVLRALAESAGPAVGGADVRRALRHAVDLVDEAIAEPVEGTILTVLRAAAVAAAECGSDALADVAAAASAEARTALAETPSMLPALQEAGVVDAGGAGLVILLDALADAAGADPGPREPITAAVPGARGAGAPGAAASGGAGAARDASSRPDPSAHADAAHAAELEVMFGIDCDADAAARLRERLAELGNSLIVGADTRGGRTVHVHTLRAGEVIEAALEAGRPRDIRIEPVFAPVARPAEPARTVLALTPEGPLADLFAASGAVPVAPGEDPVGGIVAAISGVPGDGEVVLLPNGLLDNRGLVEVELAAHAGERTITIVSTPTPANGLAALAVHDPALPLAVDAYAMSEASSGMRTAVLSPAPGPGLTMAGPCGRGDVLALVGGDIVAVGRTADEACTKAADLLLRSGGELVTLLLGADAGPESAVALRDHLARSAPGVDVVAYAAAGIGSLMLVGVE
ncbi:DAK2 domain-containing protein [Corynebacterium sp. 335C]